MPHTAKLFFSVVLKHFWRNSQRTSLFRPKSDMSERSTEILRKFVFLNIFEKGQILRKIGVCLNNFFYQTSKMVEILTKTVFLLQVRHIQPNYAFLLFWSIFGEIQRTSFLVKKVTLTKEHWITQNFFFLNMFEKGKILRKIWFCLNNFFLSNQ